MLTEEKNRLLTQVGPGTPMGNLLRRYWMPVAGVSEFDSRSTKPIRLMGEDLVLYKDLGGNFGLVDRRCAHRRADLSYGMVEQSGLRCNYHGWAFDHTGQCISQPFEDTCFPERDTKARISIKSYPVQAKGGMLWTYMGPQPAPLLPDWEAFSWDNGFSQVVISEVPCNWFQCQENSIDPVHFEWMHENWGRRLRTGDLSHGPKHLKLDFDEFEYGFVYRRTREDSGENDDAWTIGRVCLWPNGFFLGEHFEWRVPIDDENTLSVTWKYTRVPKGREPYVQGSIPTWYGPLKDERGNWIDTHVMNQDFLAWVGQGVIADRTQEHLGASDRGIVAIRRRFFDELEKVAAGGDPKGIIRDPARNVKVQLPMMDRAQVVEGFTVDEIMQHPRMKVLYRTYIFQAGQPESVRKAFSDAMGLEAQEFDGIVASRRNRI
ncbi:aromatic ring-hydroxylating dioxygenase subunit alpha [Ramlibacter ginsenosidimutans]|uniref:Aromatic ring-hydroxylating dioxygenase subunit alpha n=1 Tax=Ramlibacter ginsenosidimutans TaxID=502333 RepID=A0A934WL92_9BURK|nr:aromatic ring-hydroxylating dioxygenase subunit alpha [Ramlibacter ginsenosidimutans]MBK6004862.1 aromatic ring-hydroxylating dioxygenase subunit alpha [Ramlibacter ginsenosidimutans]